MTTPLTNKSTVDEIRERFDNDVERFSNLETGQAAAMDASLHMQLVAEAADYAEEQAVPDCDWGIVSIIGTLAPEEPPMPPITAIAAGRVSAQPK